MHERGDTGCDENEPGKQHEVAQQVLLHWPPPTCSSSPLTTPAATESMPLSLAGSSARAMPFLMRESMVLRPFESFVSVNVTMVPSGTALPLQSRMGSVSTTMLRSFFPATFMWMLHGSPAVCCTTRLIFTSPTDATNCAAPSLLAEFIFVQATPYFEVAVCEEFVPCTVRSNFTGTDSRTRFL